MEMTNLEDQLEQERRLVVRGVLMPPSKKRRLPVTWPEPPGLVSEAVIEKLWREERNDR